MMVECECECEMRMRRMEGAIGGLRGVGGVGWWVVVVRARAKSAKRNAEARTCQAKRDAKQAGHAECEGGMMGKRWKRARTLKPPLREIEIPEFRRL
jgi:hypothetical protein